ncbi:IS1-like element transposase [Aeromonas jandaei]|nr:IS1-like element transposase [Aeromonas jandaei]
MAFNGSGFCDTDRVLKIGINTVIRTLKALPKASNLRKGSAR